jgi:hypothetical protein
MLAAMLFAISIVALAQFAAYYWRAMLAGAAALPISERVLAAAGAQNGQLTGEDFPALVGIHELTPELRSGGNGLRLVRVYYGLVDSVASMVGSSMPAVGAWTQRELAVCARYAAVQVDRRLQANLELAESLRSC